jgi:branched-chain amino acid transport system permease protein
MSSVLSVRVKENGAAIALVLSVVGLALLASAGSDVIVRTATVGLIMLLATVALYVFVGNSGILSFGHAGFMMIGGYAAGLLVFPAEQKKLLLPDLPAFLQSAHVGPALAPVVGGLLAGAIALLLAVPLARLGGMPAALTTFAFLGIVYEVIANWTAVTGGPAGLAGIPISNDLYPALIWVAVAIVAASLVQNANWGRRLRASREDEVAAQASGIAIRNERRGAFVVSAFFLGVSGGLYALFLGNLTPQTIYLDVTFLTLAMLVVGGMRSLSGAVIGSVFITVVAELLRRLEGGFDLGFVHFGGRSGLREVGLALVLLGVLLWRPEGITGGTEVSLAWLRRRAKPEVGDVRPEEPLLPTLGAAEASARPER